MKNYDPADFLSKVSVKNLSTPAEVSIVGLAKSDETKPSTFQFSHSLACELWLSVPIDIVESIDHLRTIRCRDHQHPLVRIRFKRPDDSRARVAAIVSSGLTLFTLSPCFGQA